MSQNQSYQLIALTALCDAADEVTTVSAVLPGRACSHLETALRYVCDSLSGSSQPVRALKVRAREAADRLSEFIPPPLRGLPERELAAAAMHLRPTIDHDRQHAVRRMLLSLTDEQLSWMLAAIGAASSPDPNAREIAGECVQRMHALL